MAPTSQAAPGRGGVRGVQKDARGKDVSGVKYRLISSLTASVFPRWFLRPVNAQHVRFGGVSTDDSIIPLPPARSQTQRWLPLAALTFSKRLFSPCELRFDTTAF